MRGPAVLPLWARCGRRESQAIRTVEVVPPSAADEAGWVLLAAMFILLCMIYVFAFEHYGSRGPDSAATSARALLPFQVLFRDLPSAEQRMFRAMQEGAGEAVRQRAETGSWPSVDSLAAAGIPPFAPDILDKAGFRWSAQRSDLVVNFLGIPSTATDTPAFLILIREPDPVTGEKAPPPSVVDEEHQLLPDGTLLHVTYWKGSATGLGPAVIREPALTGWAQIRIKTPWEEMERR